MTYYLTLKFPKEQYSIDKSSNEFSTKDSEGNRFIIIADSDQEGKFSFCKDEGGECKFTQHYNVKDPKIYNNDTDNADYVNVIMEDYGEKDFQSRILGELNKYNIHYEVVNDGKTQDDVNVLHSSSVDDYMAQEDADILYSSLADLAI
ncbi:hypothetical protein [Wolbachia endosymbiont of Ctenocephalides felis wCfeJ]|uniref:hypothetical protein n=1 Tax=Wolbachia endosymbiont of Ctenocephalides felis wCfeJ TaxID=2732594 RepID=UPI001446B591|nr:hypothetical protein [Wolbachia endosymbiont of Ctenocephalides felis wCfeJ]WCR57994.1 MAG: hypothetical protein PG980_000466 [Wolbachia endosymbiont of Ctenocephalides felis wCfeJ]